MTKQNRSEPAGYDRSLVHQLKEACRRLKALPPELRGPFKVEFPEDKTPEAP